MEISDTIEDLLNAMMEWQDAPKYGYLPATEIIKKGLDFANYEEVWPHSAFFRRKPVN